MPKITSIQDNFSGGMVEDKRTKSSIHYALASHFDTRYANKLIPQFKTEADETLSANIIRFLYATAASGSPKKLYGLGYSDVSNKYPLLFLYDIHNGYAGGWVQLGTYTGAGSRKLPATLFYYYDFIYVWTSNGLYRFEVSAGLWDAVQQLANASQTGEPIRHPSNDIAYFPADNLLYYKNGSAGAFTLGLTFPADRWISSICAHGEFLAIAVTNDYPGSYGKDYDTNSEVYLWDMNSSLTDITERIDFGKGRIVHLASLDGRLTAVVDEDASQDVGLGRGRIVIKQANGNTFQELNHLDVDVNASNTTANDYYNHTLKSNRIIKNNKMYFSAKAVLGSDNRHGIWSVDSRGRLNLEIVEEEATSYEGIYPVGNVWFIAHSADGSVNRTDNDKAYSATLASVYESLINLGDARLAGSRKKNLVKVGIMTEALPTAGQIVLKYRKNEETSWTTIFTHTTDNSLSHFAINIEATGAPLPQFKEIQFRVESTGGAVITGVYMESELLDTDN